MLSEADVRKALKHTNVHDELTRTHGDVTARRWLDDACSEWLDAVHHEHDRDPAWQIFEPDPWRRARSVQGTELSQRRKEKAA